MYSFYGAGDGTKAVLCTSSVLDDRKQYPSHTYSLKTIINRFLNARTLLGFKSLRTTKIKVCIHPYTYLYWCR